jgi:hypothetical protein
MKKIIGLFLVLTILMFSNNLDASAQTAKTIRFAKGKNSAIVQGNTGTSGVYYDLRVRGGQKMEINLSPISKVGIKIETAGGAEVLLRENRGGFYELYFEEGGDISIFVGSTGGKSVSFSLTVKIKKLADI